MKNFIIFFMVLICQCNTGFATEGDGEGSLAYQGRFLHPNVEEYDVEEYEGAIEGGHRVGQFFGGSWTPSRTETIAFSVISTLAFLSILGSYFSNIKGASKTAGTLAISGSALAITAFILLFRKACCPTRDRPYQAL